MFRRKSSSEPTPSPSASDTVEVHWSLRGTSQVHVDRFSVPEGTQITRDDAAYTVARTKGLIFSDEDANRVVEIKGVRKA